MEGEGIKPVAAVQTHGLWGHACGAREPRGAERCRRGRGSARAAHVPPGPRAQTAAPRSPAAVKPRLNYILVNIDYGHLRTVTEMLSPAEPGPGCCAADLGEPRGDGAHQWQDAGVADRRPRRRQSIVSARERASSAEDAQGSGLSPGLNCGLICKPCKGWGTR